MTKFIIMLAILLTLGGCDASVTSQEQAKLPTVAEHQYAQCLLKWKSATKLANDSAEESAMGGPPRYIIRVTKKQIPNHNSLAKAEAALAGACADLKESLPSPEIGMTTEEVERSSNVKIGTEWLGQFHTDYTVTAYGTTTLYIVDSGPSLHFTNNRLDLISY